MAALLLAVVVPAFDASKFRTSCDQSNFCRALRPSRTARAASFALVDGSLAVGKDGIVRGTVWQPELGINSTALFVLKPIADAYGESAPVWKMQVLLAASEANNGFELSRMVLPQAPAAPVVLHEVRSGVHSARAEGGAWWSELEVRAAPLRVQLRIGRVGAAAAGPPALVFNGNGLLRFAASDAALADPASRAAAAAAACEAGGRARTREGYVDSLPGGCTALSADVTFPNALEAFGLPERPEQLALRPTVRKVCHAAVDAASGATDGRAGGCAESAPVLSTVLEPYRLYNLDVFRYGPGTPVSVYGALPFLMGVGAHGHAAGALWLNAADTYVDVWHAEGDGGDEGGGGGDEGVGSAWLSEGGALELLLFGGPTPARVLRQLALVTGRPPMPPLWSLGYHQSHWNIKSQAQAAALERNFDRHGVPLDGIWLDIEHTAGKRYFTWDAARFPHPEELDKQMRPNGRRLIAIADPHLKADKQYEVHARAEGQGWLVRSAANTTFVGKCWPGESSYLDLFQPHARAYWTSLYERGPGSDDPPKKAAYKQLADGRFEPTRTDGNAADRLGWPKWLHAWNDMNEPSVFDSDELTLPRDARHRVGVGDADERRMVDVEHRVVHNVYGSLQAAATHAGLLARTGGVERPFLLSRSFFVGSQRHGAVWTGDNTASWEHLRLSFSMILALSVSGFSFTGADVGGFFGSPSHELLARWYQAAAHLPFFRAHAHVDEARREPYLLPQPYAAIAADAIRERQRLLPYWSTTWYRAAHAIDGIGAPVVSPPWLHFGASAAAAGDSATVSVAAARATLRAEGQWMVGDALLVQPIAEPGVTQVRLRLPGGASTWWYDLTGESAHATLPAGIEPQRPVLGGEELTIATPLTATPTFQLGGTIVPRRERVRRSALLALRDPITVHIAPNATRSASGELYLDDGESTSHPAALLIAFDFACASTGTCELRATPKRVWADAPATSPSPHAEATLEAVLLRGMCRTRKRLSSGQLADVATSRAVLVPRDDESAQTEVSTISTPRGVLIGKIPMAQLAAGWTLRMVGFSLVGDEPAGEKEFFRALS